MVIDGGLAVRVETENWQTHTRISAARLRELVERIGGAGDRFLVVQRIPDLPDVFAQVWHEDGAGFRVEHRVGDEGFYGADLADAGQVADLVVGWARQDVAWDAGVVWEAVEQAPRDVVPELPDEVRVKVEERVRARLRGGYDSRRVLVEIAEEWLVDGDERPVSTAQAWQLVDRLWLERLAEQEAWEGVTDPERLSGAFRALEAGGITARENFACCRGCGMAEIGGEGEDARGFVFFHQQVTEHAADGHGLALYYGGFDGSEETTAGVGREVVAALAGVGLSTEWDGSPEKSITVMPLEWRKRLEG
ncbi:DUF6891 domain-containing protein [Streptomyces sp. NPDC057623]|uniref:DUF6891 domain-containing protein n=1 Tax=Streptomyces sp. NPDC057623 TaxID=3346187 RepID=UPI0036C789B0